MLFYKRQFEILFGEGKVMSGLPVDKDILLWALERSGKAEKLAAKFPKLDDWLEGKASPTLRQLEQYSKATLAPLGYFFLSAPPEEKLPIPHFRTLKDEQSEKASPELIETINTYLRRQEWMREYLREQGHEPLSFIASVKDSDSAEVISENIKQTLGLPKQGWGKDIRTWTEALKRLTVSIEQCGIMVTFNGVLGNNTWRTLNVEEFRGFVLVDDYAPLIFINNQDSKAAQMFTLAHELAHLWLGSSAVFDLRQIQPADDRIEIQCNNIAAEFLVPGSELKEFWVTVKSTDTPFGTIARRFKVSEIVAARRVMDLELITKEEFFSFYDTYLKQNRNIVRDDEWFDSKATQKNRLSRLFTLTVLKAVREGNLLYNDAYRLTGLYGEKFEDFAYHLTNTEK